jgi:thioredoxin:protein disulfide reductase
MKKALLAMIAWPLMALAQPWWLNGSKANQADFLPPDTAFRVSSVMDGDLIRIRWIIADGYYLYRAKFDIKPESPDLVLESAVFPKGTSRTDEYFGTQEIYQHEATAVAGFKRADAGAHPVQIRVTYQGCAEAGLCYPPIVKVLNPEPLSQPVLGPAPDSPAPVAAAAARQVDGGAVFVATLGGLLAFFIAGWNRRRKHNPAAL